MREDQLHILEALANMILDECQNIRDKDVNIDVATDNICCVNSNINRILGGFELDCNMYEKLKEMNVI